MHRFYSFQHKLQDIFKDVHETYAGIDGRLKAEQFKVCNKLQISAICVMYSLRHLVITIFVRYIVYSKR